MSDTTAEAVPADSATPVRPYPVVAARYVTIHLASAMTGLTASAIRTKISRGVWCEGREYVRAADGHVMIDMRGYERWVEAAAASR